jgi:hypothetical protein
MKEPIGDMGVRGRFEIPGNFIGIPKLVAAIILISLLASMVLILSLLGQRNDESFKRFIRAEKAGVFMGVTMSPLSNPKTYKHEGTWIIEIAGAGDNTLQTEKTIKGGTK